MKPNEIIGSIAILTMIAGIFLILFYSNIFGGILFVTGAITQAIFLSFWGLETFNNKFKK